MKQENFFHFTNFPDLQREIIDEGLNAKYEWWVTPNNLRAETTTFQHTEIYKVIVDNFGYCKAAFYKNLPFMLYDWHSDNNRMASINWVIQSDDHAYCFFRDLIEGDPYSKEILERGYSNPLFWQLEKVEYKLYRPTILRTKAKHSVINASPKERIILSVTIGTPYTTYEEIKYFLSNLKF